MDRVSRETLLNGRLTICRSALLLDPAKGFSSSAAAVTGGVSVFPGVGDILIASAFRPGISAKTVDAVEKTIGAGPLVDLKGDFNQRRATSSFPESALRI